MCAIKVEGNSSEGEYVVNISSLIGLVIKLQRW